MKIRIILTLITVLLSYMTNAQVNDQTKLRMFCEALANTTTSPNYVVITLKNLKTGETKEICTEAPFLEGAMSYENGKRAINCKDYPTRQFAFSKPAAIQNVSLYSYSKSDLAKYARSIDIATVLQQVKSGKLKSKTFKGDGLEKTMFAHLMFNNGIMITRGCIDGSVCTMVPFKSR